MFGGGDKATSHVSRLRAEFQRFQFSPPSGTAIIGPAQLQLYNSSLLTGLGKIFILCLLTIDGQSYFKHKKAVTEEGRPACEFKNCFKRTRYQECIRLCYQPLHPLLHLHNEESNKSFKSGRGRKELASAQWGALVKQNYYWAESERRGQPGDETVCLSEQLET